MFNIGTWELVVIVALALIILGPKQLPQVARSLGKTLARLRHSLEEAKREMGLDELKRQIESETIEEGELEELQQLLDVRAQVRQAGTAAGTSPPASGRGSRPAVSRF